MKELLLGCGHRRIKDVYWPDQPKEFQNVTTVDIYPESGADVIHDLNILPYPFADEEFDEIHAYEILEHIGAQGDWKLFFGQFNEFYRILKPQGMFFASVPYWKEVWAWGDPGHTRIINEGTLSFLSQKHYEQCATTSRTDYRGVYKGDFDVVSAQLQGDNLVFGLRKL